MYIRDEAESQTWLSYSYRVFQERNKRLIVFRAVFTIFVLSVTHFNLQEGQLVFAYVRMCVCVVWVVLWPCCQRWWVVDVVWCNRGAVAAYH